MVPVWSPLPAIVLERRCWLTPLGHQSSRVTSQLGDGGVLTLWQSHIKGDLANLRTTLLGMTVFGDHLWCWGCLVTTWWFWECFVHYLVVLTALFVSPVTYWLGCQIGHTSGKIGHTWEYNISITCVTIFDPYIKTIPDLLKSHLRLNCLPDLRELCEYHVKCCL